MSKRRLGFALLIYVTLDFSNPLMPGAVQFDGSVDVVQADRARAQPVGMTLDLSSTPEPVVDLIQIQVVRRPSSRGLPARYQVAIRIRHAPLRSSSDFPPSSEDH